ncbi:hypothetical protein JTF06_09565 [Desemzia sp. RIT804]|nr:hypothetical protein [Desemzia sp. RIT 804]
MKQLLFLMTLAGVLVGCGNKELFDTTYTFEYAMISLPNGDIVEGKLKSWTDYDGEQLQITFENGDTYLVSSMNAILKTKK